MQIHVCAFQFMTALSYRLYNTYGISITINGIFMQTFFRKHPSIPKGRQKITTFYQNEKCVNVHRSAVHLHAVLIKNVIPRTVSSAASFNPHFVAITILLWVLEAKASPITYVSEDLPKRKKKFSKFSDFSESEKSLKYNLKILSVTCVFMELWYNLCLSCRSLWVRDSVFL